jgi:hypothetical protein
MNPLVSPRDKNFPRPRKNALILGLGALLSAFAPSGSQAAALIWGPATTASADTDVLNTGTILQALNFGFSGSAVTVNGVNFTSVPSFSYGSPMGGGPGAVVLGNDGYVDNGGLAAFSVFGSNSAPFVSLSSGYQDLLRSAGYRQTSTASNLLFSIGGLMIGQTYRVQFWANDARGAGAGRQTTYSAVTAATLDQNSTDSDGGPGQYVTGYFIADASTQTIRLTATTPTSVSLVSAYTLAAVTGIPEPSAAALWAGLAVLGGTMSRRRRNRD